MSERLARLRLLTVDYSTLFAGRAALAITAAGPFEPAGNKNTAVAIQPDTTDPFKFTLQYQEDKVPEREGFEWHITSIFPGMQIGGDADGDGKVTVTIVFFGGVEQGPKELTFDLVPGDVVGRHSGSRGLGTGIL